mgnify:CR=1 FL=1
MGVVTRESRMTNSNSLAVSLRGSETAVSVVLPVPQTNAEAMRLFATLIVAVAVAVAVAALRREFSSSRG